MKLIHDRDHFTCLLMEGILRARNRVWIATANLKDLHIPGKSRGSKPFLEHLVDLQQTGVKIRILHGGKPGKLFLNTLNNNTELHTGDGFEMQHCPRVHCKILVVDNRIAYSGSANLTGAGLGAKSVTRRNFESGTLFQEENHIGELEDYFDRIWMGEYCRDCGRRKICPEPFY